MEDYLHRVVGLYPTGTQADSAVAKLLQGGLAIENLTVLEPRRDGTQPQIAADDEDILKEVLREGAIGTAIGTFAGAAGSVALAAVNISLFIASPVLAPLVMLGWGASLGGLVGAVAGAQSSKGGVSDLIRDALASGHFALVAHADTEAQATLAREVIGASMVEPGAASKAEIDQPLATSV